MELGAYLDQYCERIQPGFFAEPLNLFSNLAFLVAAWMAYALYRRSGLRRSGVQLLCLLAAVVGVGSSLFHSFATVWSKIADVVPIGIFVICYLGYYLTQVLKARAGQVAMVFAVFVAVSAVLTIAIPKEAFNGSQGYFGTFLGLLGIAAWGRTKSVAGYKKLLVAAGVFSLSLTFRSLDMALCAHLTIGTHFLWHICNGVVIWACLAGAIDGLVSQRS